MSPATSFRVMGQGKSFISLKSVRYGVHVIDHPVSTSRWNNPAITAEFAFSSKYVETFESVQVLWHQFLVEKLWNNYVLCLFLRQNSCISSDYSSFVYDFSCVIVVEHDICSKLPTTLIWTSS